VIAPDADTLARRWNTLLSEPDPARKELLFHPTLRKDKKTGAYIVAGRHIRKIVHERLGSRPARVVPIIDETEPQTEFALYGFRSFDRQFLIADVRVMSDPRPNIWNAEGGDQLYLTAPMDLSPSGGPALTVTALPPDKHHYNGRGGHVFALWKDAAATIPNIPPAFLAELAKRYGAPVDPVDVFSYVAALLAHPDYVERFRADLIQPGLRVPLTADAKLFKEAARLGREVIWLHTFGDRFGEGRPAGPPRVAVNPPTVPKDGAIPSIPGGFPDSIDYNAAKRRLKVGTGHIDNVAPEVWAYEVSGKNVLRQWFSYRKRNRERPLIGDKRPPSPLGDIQPDHWLPEYTSELINVLNVLTLLVELEPKQAKLLDEICDGPLIPASRIIK
jgi:hypothetical protein